VRDLACCVGVVVWVHEKSTPPLAVSDKYTHPNTVIAKHNGDDKPHDTAMCSAS